MKNYLVLFVLISVAALGCSNTGKTLDEFSITDLKGSVYTQSNLQNSTTVVVVWATWCRPCLQKIPALNALKEKHPDIQFWALSDDEVSQVKALNQRLPFHWTLFANSESLTDQLQTRLVKTYPQFVVIKNGTILYEETTESADGLTRLEEFLDGQK